MSTNWQSFSIGENNSVTFVQPNSQSVALNTVLGSDPSLIQGRLSANGQIFLVNPNGILFSPSAQVNVGGLVASTLRLSTEDFMAGNYKFSGLSSNAIVNQGHIVASNGGTIALIAAKIVNQGTITAQQGSVLGAAGSQVTLDMGGPVKISVDLGALNAQIEQGGAIRADGGLVYLTAKAASELASAAISNTGVIEAQTLSTGETGQIYLIADKKSGTVLIDGELDASAPNGGNGGFIETSAANVSVKDSAKVTTAAPSGSTGTWLIDPTNIAIAAGSCTGTNCLSASTIETNLGSSNVTIQTDPGGAEAGNITINAPISWAANTLTFNAANNILINGTLTASGTGSLSLLYGQATADGGSSTYTVGTGSKIYIPAATAFTWQKGSGGTLTNLIFNNGSLRFGNGTEASIDGNGQLKQPFYFDNTSVVGGVTRNGWYKLTFSNYPLDQQISTSGDGTNAWNTNGSTVTTQGTSWSSAIVSGSPQLDITNYKEGVGTIVASENLTVGGQVIKLSNSYTLAANTDYMKTDTTITNLDASPVTNLRLWVGTRDDYIAQNDDPYKFKGNLDSSGFVEIATQTDQAKALKITERTDGEGAAVLFYSTSSGADTAVNGCCNFSNATGQNPRTSDIESGSTDGSYALFIRLSDLANNQSSGMTWYYAAAPVAEISQVVTQVSESAGVTPPPAPPTEPEPPVVVVVTQETPPQLTSAIQTIQTQPPTDDQRQTLPGLPGGTQSFAFFGQPGTTQPPQGTISGSLEMVDLPPQFSPLAAPDSGAPTSESDNASHDNATNEAHTLLASGGSTGSPDFFRVFVVNGGINIPSPQAKKNKPH